MILMLNCLFTYGQNESDTNNNISLGLSTYTFENKISNEGLSTAFGPSLVLNDEKLSIQIGILYENKKYVYSFGGRINSTVIKYSYLYFPLLFHYNFYTRNRFSYFFSFGFFLRDQILFDKNDYFNKKIDVNFVGCIGGCYKMGNKLSIKVYPTARYIESNFYPGLTLDLLIQIVKNKN